MISPSFETTFHHPGDPAYEDACTLFNAMVDTRPELVARCATAADVIEAWAYARTNVLPVAVRAGGHSVTGRSLVEDGLVLDVRPMNRVTVDPVRRTVRAEGGATWADVDRATQAHRLATTGGRVSSTGVVGLTLGGGSGWLERRDGLACDNLQAIELVTADGRCVRADAHEHSELLWAMRGGGANFGVVTAVELALHPLPEQVLAGLVLHPHERAGDVLTFFADLMRDAPDELSIAYLDLLVPAEAGIPAALHGRRAAALAGLWIGDVAEGERELARLRAFGPPAADLFEPMAYADFQCALDDPPGFRNWWTSEYVEELTPDAIAEIARRGAQLPAGPSQVLIARWGGAVARQDPAQTPMRGRDAGFVVHPLMLWEAADADAAMIAQGRAFRDALAPWATGHAYLNFIGDEGEQRVRAAFGPAFERLAAVKRTWDPDEVFHGNQSIPVQEAARV
jgi:FAD/FMN-containing dehydrogenase